MSKTVSARIPQSKHDELRERCNQKGCTVNDFVKASLEFALDGSTDFDFDDEEDLDDDIDDEPSEIEPMPLKEKRPSLINEFKNKFEPHYDRFGNYHTYDQNRQVWTTRLNLKNVRIIS